MLVLNKTYPNISLYYLGSRLIHFFYESGVSEFHLTDLYQKYNKLYPITFNRFMLALDWLFLCGIVSGSEGGRLKCNLKLDFKNITADDLNQSIECKINDEFKKCYKHTLFPEDLSYVVFLYLQAVKFLINRNLNIWKKNANS